MSLIVRHGWLLYLLFASAQLNAMTLDQAVAEAKASSTGQVISASTRERDGKVVHIIRILGDDGRVRRLFFPADPAR